MNTHTPRKPTARGIYGIPRTLTTQRQREYAERLASAYNNTYVVGINPEAVPLLIDALREAQDQLGRAAAIIASPDVPRGPELVDKTTESLFDTVALARAALAKAREG